MDTVPDVTRLLLAHRAGDPEALDRLVSLVYRELRQIARRVLARDAPRTLTATAVVHEAWMHLSAGAPVAWENRAHFFAIAARAMRQIVVDDARRRAAHKRGGDRLRVTLVPEHAGATACLETALSVDQVLSQLGAANARLVQVAECKLFAGMTDAETAEALGVPLRTVQREWQRARAWLQRGLTGAAERTAGTGGVLG
jgi:RNA polymerase sigma factor (TIGR02999 family)